MLRGNIIKYATYTDIEVGLMQEPYSIRSVSKLVFISFCVYYQSGKKYNKLDITQTFFSTLSGKLLSHLDDIQMILCVISMLEKCDFIAVDEEGTITTLHDVEKLTIRNPFLIKFKTKKERNPIIDINRLDDKAFMEEVVRYV